MAVSTVSVEVSPDLGWVKIAGNPSWIRIRAQGSRQWHLTVTASGAPLTQASSASGTITFSGLPLDTQTVTIGGTVYTFVAAAPTGDEVLIGATGEETRDNLLAALQGNPDVFAVANGTLVIDLSAQASGVSGNSVALSTTATNVAVSGAALSGGAGITPYLTMVPTYQSDGWRFESDVAIAGEVYVRTPVAGAQGQKMVISAIKDETP